MKIELKQVIEQLTEAVGLKNPRRVAALIDEEDNNKLVGWTIVMVNNDGRLTPIKEQFKTIKELWEHCLNDSANNRGKEDVNEAR